MALGQLPQAGEESRSGGQAAMQGFHDDGRQIAGVAIDQVRGGGQIIERRDQDAFPDARRSGARSIGLFAIGGRAAEHAGDTGRVLSMVGAGEFENARATGGRVGDPEGQHGCLRAGGDEADTLRARRQRGQTFGQFDGAVIDGGEVDRASDLPGNGLDDLGMGMADQCRTPGHGQVQVFPVVGVPNTATLTPRKHRQQFWRESKFTVGTSGKAVEGAFAEGEGRGGGHFYGGNKINAGCRGYLGSSFSEPGI